MARQPRVFKYFCPKCGRQNTAICKGCGALYIFDTVKQPYEKWIITRVRFGERQYQRILARARVTPGVNGPAELIRLMCDECLAMPPVRLISA